MVPDDSLTIRERAIAAWPPAWHGQNLRDILVTLGYDVDSPWRELPKKDRDWILFTDEQPVVPVYAGFTPDEARRALKRKEEPSYQGTFTARGGTCCTRSPPRKAPPMKKRVAQYLLSTECPLCQASGCGPNRCRSSLPGSTSPRSRALPLQAAGGSCVPCRGTATGQAKFAASHPEKAIVASGSPRTWRAGSRSCSTSGSAT